VKIVVLPGVGFHLQKTKEKHARFAKRISEGLGCDCEMFYWEHRWDIPDVDFPYKSIREFVAEVILDFQKTVKDAPSMKIPEADVYIGHSAGSIMALLQMKPSVIFGSPASLVETLYEGDDVCKEIIEMFELDCNAPILNIINKYDLLSYPLEWNNVENVIIKPSIFNPASRLPVYSHHYYWKDKRVADKIVETIKKWGLQ